MSYYLLNPLHLLSFHIILHIHVQLVFKLKSQRRLESNNSQAKFEKNMLLLLNVYYAKFKNLLTFNILIIIMEHEIC